MNGKSKSILKSIIAFVMALAMVLGAVPLPFVPGSMVAQAAAFTGGDGTAENPYLIENADDLINLSTRSGYNYGDDVEGKYFLQTADITLTEAFTPIGNTYQFAGTYDGGNHVISGLSVSADKGGLFARVGDLQYGGTVKNVVLYKPNITGSGDAGAIAAHSSIKGIFENCCVISPTISGSNKGAIVGTISNGKGIQIKDCSVYGSTLPYENNNHNVGTQTTLYKLTLPAGVTAEATSGTLKATVSVAGGTECYCTSGTVFTLTADDSIVSGTGLKQFTTTAGTLDATSTAGQVTLTMPDSADATVTLEDVSPTITVAETTYNGSAQTPAVTVKVGSTTLSATDNYTVGGYSNNTNAGDTASVSITGKGLYVGTATQTFSIGQKEVGLTWVSESSFTYNGSEQAPTATATGLCGNDTCTVTVTGATNAGEQTATATGLSNNNYKLPAEKTHTFTISPAAANVTADDKSKTYNESDPELTATVTGLVGSDAASVISYSLSRAAGEDVGTYAITPTGETAQGNYTVTYTPGTFTINAAAAPSLVDANKPTANTLTYNGGDQALVTAPTSPLSGYTLKYSTDSGSTWSETIPTGKNATDYTVKAKYFGDGNHADSAEMSVAVSIAPKPVTVDGITASDKTYDGTTTATLVTTGATFTGIESGDTLTVSATGAFADANAGDSKNVTISGLTLGGASKDNYVLAGSGQQTTTTAKINKKNVTVTAKAQTIEVNGSIVTDTTQVELTDELSGHTLSAVTLTADSTSSVGAHTITPSEATIRDGSSNDVTGNYNITYADGTLTVTNVQVYISGVTASNKTYDGGTSATITGTAVLKKVNGDEVVSGLTVSNITAAFADKNVGTGKSVTITGGTLSDSTNYTLVPSKTTGLTADITAKSVTITGLSAANKVYDGNATATVKGTAVIDGKVSGDTVTVTAGSAAFENVNAGTGKTVTFSGYSLSGTDKDNYTLSAQPASVTANITKATPTITDVPTVGAITYGQQLSEVENSFSGGSVKLNGNDVNGTFVWSDGTLKPAVSDSNKTEYIVKFTPTDSGNLNDTTCKVKLTVNKADIADSAVNAPTAKTLTYTGSAQELIVAGSSTAGTMQYALGADAVTAPTTGWGTALPMGKNAGTHYVWYKIIGDANHNDKAPVKLEVAIAKATGLTKTADMTVEAQPGTNVETKVTLRQYLGDGVTLSSSTSGTTEGTITFSDISLSSSGELTFKTTSESGGKGHIELTVSSANYENYKLGIPVEIKARITQVKLEAPTGGTQSSVTGVEVKGLSDYTNDQTADSVKVVIDVKPEMKNSVENSVSTKIDDALNVVFANVDAGDRGNEYLDISVKKQEGDAAEQKVENVGRVIEIAIHYDLTGKFNPVVIREHKGETTVFTGLVARPNSGFTDATFYVDTVNGIVYIYSELFSTYTIAYAKAASYTVTFDSQGGNAVSPYVVKSGGTIGTLPVTTRSGYTLDGWFTAANGGTKLTTATVISGDVAYYAHWTENANGGSGGSGGGGNGGGSYSPGKTTPARPAAPALDSKTDASITVKTAAGQVYSIDGGKHWQASGTFTGLLPETEYSIVTKISETASSYESAVSDALKVKTDKKAGSSTPTAGPGGTSTPTGKPEDTAAPDSTTAPTDQPGDTAAPDSTTTPTDQPGDTAAPGSTETPDAGKKPAAEGTVLVDAGKTAGYIVTSADAKHPTVAYKQCRNKKAKKVTIPKTVKIGGVTYTVTSIAANAFKNHKTITRVTMGKNIRTIGENAFYGCKKLNSVTIGKNVTKIGTGAFSGCKKLVTVKMGSKVSVIGDKAFYNCASLKSITLPKTVKKIGKNAFYGCGKLKKITVKTKKLTLKNVGKDAFSGISIRASVLVPEDKRKEYALLFRKRGAGKKIRIKTK